MQQRVLNERSSFVVNITEPMGGNYYPMNELAYVEDTQANVRLTLVTDRTRGVSSQEEVCMRRKNNATTNIHTRTCTLARTRTYP